MKRLLACLALLPPAASAQAPPTPTVILIRPAAPPVPALKHRIVPDGRALVPGNAAIFYHRAIQMYLNSRSAAQSHAQSARAEPPPGDDATIRWINGPLGEIPLEQARLQLQIYRNALAEVELGSQRRTCDWEFDSRAEGFSLLMPEIQEIRSLGRLVTLAARVAVLEGRTDDAVRWLRAGYAMSRHVGQGPTLIQALMGCAIDNMLARSFTDLIQAPGTPSLYWALANRPRPFIDLTAAFAGEPGMIRREMPMLLELDTGIWSVEKARLSADKLLRDLGHLTDMEQFARLEVAASGSIPPRIEDLPARLTMIDMVIKAYPDAKRALIAGGRPAAEVEAMPAFQVVLIHTMADFACVEDDVYKWGGVPFRQSLGFTGRAIGGAKAEAKARRNPLLALFISLLPAVEAVRMAADRVDRQLDAFQCIEAIRLYAAAHDGALPPTLDAIVEAPVPLDPATGKSFEYKVSGEAATLSGPLPPGAPNHPSFLIRYELKLAR